MAAAAASREYERAALLRDQITELKSGSGVSKIEPRRSRMKYPVARKARKKTPIA
jgi:excinuclease ABC subunit B